MGSNDPNRDRIDILKDVYLSTVFLTRLRAPEWPAAAERPLGTAAWAFPLTGVIVGVLGAAAYALSDAAGVPALIGAFLAIGTMAIATGGLHEDGLSDFADGVWGGSTPDRRLEIMTDSRVGAYGVVAIVLAIGMRAAAIAAIGQPVAVLGALLAASAVSRANMTLLMAFVDPAKSDGLGAGAGSPPFASWGIAALLAITIVAIAAPAGWFWCLVAALAAAVTTACLAKRALGGHTGDVLGAAQQLSEIAALAIIAAALTQSG